MDTFRAFFFFCTQRWNGNEIFTGLEFRRLRLFFFFFFSACLPPPSLCLYIYLVSAGLLLFGRRASVLTCNRTDPIVPSFFRRLHIPFFFLLLLLLLLLSFSQCINTPGGFQSTAGAPSLSFSPPHLLSLFFYFFLFNSPDGWGVVFFPLFITFSVFIFYFFLSLSSSRFLYARRVLDECGQALPRNEALMIFLCVFFLCVLLLLNDTGDLSSASEDDNSDEDSDSRDLAAYHCRHCFSTCKYFEEENKKKCTFCN